MMPSIDAIVPKHFELFFRDVLNKAGDEIHRRDAFGNCFVVFMSGVVKSDIFTIVVINARRSNYRTTEISADVFNSNRRSAQIRPCTNIKTVGVIVIDIIFNSGKGRTKFQCEFFEKDFAESIPKECKIEMSNFTPRSKITGGTFRNESMDVGIPFQVTTKGIEDANESWNKVFGLIHLVSLQDMEKDRC